MLVQFWAFEATVQISVMGQKQADQKAVVAHSCALNHCAQFFCRRVEDAQTPVLGAHLQTRKLMYDYWGRRITRSQRRVKRIGHAMEFQRKKSVASWALKL